MSDPIWDNQLQQWDETPPLITTGTGSPADIFVRLQRLLPNGWFGDVVPVLDALLMGLSSALSFGYSLAAFTYLQARIKTATDYFLDLASLDYFGSNLQRQATEKDSLFRNRILAMLLNRQTTRPGIIYTLTKLTGRVPKVFEPARISDTGVYDGAYIGYDIAGGYSALNFFPYQALIVVAQGNGVSNNDINNWTNIVRPSSTIFWEAIIPNNLAFNSAPNSEFIGAISCHC
jgi:hypothetical protein